jgi:hypothetical protein
VIHPPILPSCLCLDFLFPPHCAKASHPSYQISAHVVLVPPLTDNVKNIDSGPRFSFPQQVHPVPLDVLPSPLPCLLAFKNRRSSKMILRIVASCCQRWRCCHPKARSVCQPDGSLIFHGMLPMQSFSGEKPDIDCIWQDGKLDLSPG